MKKEGNYKAGVEEMRRRAIEIVNCWQDGKWAHDGRPLSVDEVHQLLTAIGADITVAMSAKPQMETTNETTSND